MNVVITGASKGIGLAISRLFLSKGANIAICARNLAGLEALQNQWLREYPGQRVLVKAVDCGIAEEVKAFAAFVLAEMHTVDVLVNNAGVFIPGAICEEEEGHFETTMQINVHSAYHLTRALAPAMKAQAKGHIFNICSVAALKAYPGGGSYSISKYALLGLSDNLRLELMPYNIKVTALSPGAVWTHSWAGSGVAEERLMKANDVAELIWSSYQLSPQANVEHITLRPISGDL